MLSGSNFPRNAPLSGGPEAGRSPTFDELLERHLGALRTFVRPRIGRLIRARESSGDVVQSICRGVLDDPNGFEYRGEAGFRRWLFRRAERKIIDKGRFYGRDKRDVRRDKELRTGTGDGSSIGLDAAHTLNTPSRQAVAHEELERLESAFRQLPEDYRQVLVLARLVGLPHASIARRLGRSEGATRKLLSRALARLATLMDAPEDAKSAARQRQGTAHEPSRGR
jgi:RNA polymerase sigma factor (sigma-70 family)